MKTLLYLALLLYPALPSGKDQRLQLELKQMRETDQDILNGQMKSGQQQHLPDSIQKAHNTKLWQIFRTYGYPDYDMVDAVGADDFWLLVQHQDKDTLLQKAVLTSMSEKVKQGKASLQKLAYLTDRVLVNTGHPQVYGTQMVKSASGTKVPRPLAYPDRVDSLRGTVGLGPLDDYKVLMNTLTIDSAGNIYYGKKNIAATEK